MPSGHVFSEGFGGMMKDLGLFLRFCIPPGLPGVEGGPEGEAGAAP